MGYAPGVLIVRENDRMLELCTSYCTRMPFSWLDIRRDVTYVPHSSGGVIHHRSPPPASNVSVRVGMTRVGLCGW